MKFITVTGINLQFDYVKSTIPLERQVEIVLSQINEKLSISHPSIQPQISLTDASEITIIEPKES